MNSDVHMLATDRDLCRSFQPTPASEQATSRPAPWRRCSGKLHAYDAVGRNVSASSCSKLPDVILQRPLRQRIRFSTVAVRRPLVLRRASFCFFFRRCTDGVHLVSSLFASEALKLSSVVAHTSWAVVKLFTQVPDP